MQEYNPPHYQIAATLVTVVEETDFYNVYIVIKYNWYTKETFTLNKYGNFEKDDIKGNEPYVPNLRARSIRDVIFNAAYNMPFYGY